MAALPPLPDQFGNPLVRDFNEIVPAAEIDWLPQTWGWYVLAVIIGFGMLRWLYRSLRQWLRNRYRREALRRLDSIASQSPLSLTAINVLIKTTAMVATSRQEVASLTGDAWVNWLRTRVSPKPDLDILHTYLTDTMYTGSVVMNQSDPNVKILLAAVRWWILNHKDDHGPA